jgi:hypothetical protein
VGAVRAAGLVSGGGGVVAGGQQLLGGLFGKGKRVLAAAALAGSLGSSAVARRKPKPCGTEPEAGSELSRAVCEVLLGGKLCGGRWEDSVGGARSERRPRDGPRGLAARAEVARALTHTDGPREKAHAEHEKRANR